MAGVTRLELATSGLTGQRSNQLSYTPASKAYAARCAAIYDTSIFDAIPPALNCAV